MPDFVGGDPESNASECPAVFVDPETGDFLFRGKAVTDPALITALSEHIGKAEDGFSSRTASSACTCPRPPRPPSPALVELTFTERPSRQP